MARAKKQKKKEKNKIDEMMSGFISYFAEDHGLHTLFIIVMVVLLSLFVIVLSFYYLK